MCTKGDSEKNDDRVELDNVTQDFRISNSYYVVNIMLFSIVFLFNYVCACNFVFVAPNVEYRCNYDGCNDTFLSNNTIYSKCDRYLPKNDYPTCSIDDYFTNKSEYCDRWVYENPNTLVAEFDLGCQDWKRTSIGSIHSIGYLIGLLIVGPLSDKFGRKLLVVVMGILGGVLGASRGFVNSYWSYVTLEFFEAFLGDPMSPLFTLAIELAPPKKRILFTTIIYLGLSMGSITAALLLWLLPYWRTFLIVIYISYLFVSLFLLFVDESPRWLLSKGRKDEAIEILNKIAAVQNLKLDDKKIHRLEVTKDAKHPGLMNVFKMTFASKILVTRFTVCCFWWIAMVFFRFGSFIILATLKGSIYLNFSLQTGSDIIGFVLSAIVQTKMQRKKPLFVVFLLCGLFFMSQGLLTSSENTWLTIILFMCGRTMSATLLLIINVYTSELFPTYTRNTMHALCSAIGRIGSILAPQTPLLIQYWSGLPSLLFGIIALIASLLTLIVPDTGEMPLPDSVKEAEDVGKDQ